MRRHRKTLTSLLASPPTTATFTCQASANVSAQPLVRLLQPFDPVSEPAQQHQEQLTQHKCSTTNKNIKQKAQQHFDQ